MAGQIMLKGKTSLMREVQLKQTSLLDLILIQKVRS